MDNSISFGDVAARLEALMHPCTLCPRMCRINRSKGQVGFCGIGDTAVISSSGPHFGEESVLVGQGGSGTIFFSGCNLGCVFCQNFEISHYRQGSRISTEQLAESMLQLQRIGCININLVTPTHIIPPVIRAIETAMNKGLHLPIVYNSGGYDAVETLRLLEGMIDIYMPDMKYADSAIAKQLSDAADYPQINRQAILEMHRQVGDLQIQQGIAKKGLLVRHLVLPNQLAGSMEIIDFLAGQVSSKTAINVMDQYHPCFRADSYPQINRRPYRKEIESVIQYAAGKGLTLIS